MNIFEWNCFRSAHAFGATILRLAFAFLFILVAVQKFRMGFEGFAKSLVYPTVPTLLSTEFPDFVLYTYGYLLPVVEFISGVLLLVNKYTREAYIVISLVILTFVFGQEYNGNSSIVNQEFIPLFIALILAMYCEESQKKR